MSFSAERRKSRKSTPMYLQVWRGPKSASARQSRTTSYYHFPRQTCDTHERSCELIDGYMEDQGSVERRACVRCGTICADDDSIALHWREEHCEPVAASSATR